MTINTKLINNEKIKVIPVPKINPNEILGYNVIPCLHTNIFICAQKKSGKTNVIFKIIESCIDSDTKVFVFCSTHNNDPAWLFIKKYFNKNKIQSVFFSSLFEDDIDQLETALEFVRTELGENAEIENNKKQKIIENIEIIKFDTETKSSKIKIKKKKKQSPKYLFIFDDLSIELKKRNVPFLLQTFRHYQAKVIVSTQWLSDLEPKSTTQFDFWLLFKNHTKEKLEKIYGNIGCNLEFDKFYEIYKKITEEPYQFLFIDKSICQLRKNFNEIVQI